MNAVTEFKKEVYKCLNLANINYNLYSLIDNQCINKAIYISFYTASSTAGWASHWYEDGKIKKLILRFNAFYIQDNYEYMVNDIIPHEISHLLCYLLYPKEQVDHNHLWQEICINLGGSGKRYHTMKALKSNKKMIKYEYHINDKHIYLPSKIHFKAQKSFTNHQIDGMMTRVFKNMYTGKTVITSVD